MSPTLYSFLLVGYTFFTFAGPKRPEDARKAWTISGILSLIMFVAGFGLLSKLYGNQFHGFIILKIVCWLGLSAMAGMAYRRPQSVRSLAYLSRLLVLLALWAVYFRPFL